MHFFKTLLLRWLLLTPSYFADFEQVKNLVAILLTLNKLKKLTIKLSFHGSGKIPLKWKRHVQFNNKTMVQVKFHLTGKDMNVQFNNKAVVQVKFHLSGKDADVQFNNRAAVQVKFHLSEKDTDVQFNNKAAVQYNYVALKIEQKIQ